MTRRVLSHTADTGVEATAASLAGLIGELAAGMFELIATAGTLQRRIETRVTATTPEDMVVDTLSELLSLAEVEDLVLSDFEVTVDGGSVAVRAGGVPVADAEPAGPPIKAVTYHGLVAERRDGGWFGRVYFDV